MTRAVKRILFFISEIGNTGGTERASIAVANELAMQGNETRILSMYGDKPFFDISGQVGIAAIFQKKRDVKWMLPIVIARIRSTIKSFKPDVVISVDAALYIYSFAATTGLGIKHIVWEHFNFNVSQNSLARTWSRRLAARFSDMIITLTERDRSQWVTNLSCKPPVITVTNPSGFKVAETTLIPKGKIVLSVGRLTFQKGFDRLIEAWRLIQARGQFGDWQLLIVGSGEMEKELKSMILGYGLEKSVLLVPATRQIDAYYHKASLYCLSSRYEGFPLVLLEAQSFGLPLISFDCETGPAEIITPGYNGLLAPADNVIRLSELLEEMMRNDELRKSMQVAARAESAKYDIGVVAAEWKRLINIVTA